MREIGLRSPSAVTGLALGIGDIKESFHIVGNMQAEKDALKISVTGRESPGAKLFQIRFGMPSGPLTVNLKVFISDSFLHTSLDLISGSSY